MLQLAANGVFSMKSWSLRTTTTQHQPPLCQLILASVYVQWAEAELCCPSHIQFIAFLLAKESLSPCSQLKPSLPFKVAL